MSLAQTILDGVVSGYLYRRSWHGTSLEARDAEELTAVKEAVSALIWAGSIQVRSEDEDPNPAIMRLWAAPLEKQFAWVEASEDNGVYLFPTRAVLVDRPEIAELREEPYTQRLALGAPQLAPAFFELGVLDRYRRDPRY